MEYTCKECGKPFKSKGKLAAHARWTHNTIRVSKNARDAYGSVNPCDRTRDELLQKPTTAVVNTQASNAVQAPMPYTSGMQAHAAANASQPNQQAAHASFQQYESPQEREEKRMRRLDIMLKRLFECGAAQFGSEDERAKYIMKLYRSSKEYREMMIADIEDDYRKFIGDWEPKADEQTNTQSDYGKGWIR
jgi:hypothetical protein